MAKICIVSAHLYSMIDPQSAASMGGGELDLYTIAQYLKRKHKLSIVTGDWGQGGVTNHDGMTVYASFRLGGRDYITNVIRLWRALTAANADIYISSAAGPEVGIIALFCKLHHRKYIFRAVSDIDCDGTYVLSNGLAGKMYRFGLHRADAIAMSMASNRAMFAKAEPHLTVPLHHIPLAILMKSHKKSVSNKETVLWVGRCVPMKNPQIFIDLAKQFPHVPFVMIAPEQYHERSLFQSIKQQAKQLKNMQFFNYVPFANIQRYYDQAKVLVNTSDFEGYTYTLIQCGMSATPIAYSKVNPDEVITKHHLGVFADGDMQRLTQGIKRLLEDKKHWRESSRHINQFVAGHHDIDAVGQDWDRLITNMMLTPSGKID